MRKRAFWFGLLLASTQLAAGCCYNGGWCNRPYLFRPWAAGYYGASAGECCGGGGTTAHAPPVYSDFGPPPIAPTGPGMPRATDLSRR